MKLFKYSIGIIGIIIFIVALAGVYKFNYLSNQLGYDVDGNKIHSTGEAISSTLDQNKKLLSDDSETMTIRIPQWNLDNSVQFTEYIVPKSLGVLHASYEKLFELRSNENGYNGLFYDAVILDNGIAQLFLTGSWLPVGDISGAYMRNTINETAFQFETVESIEVYLNENLFDWCMDDTSDGEGGCLETPRFWIDSK